MNKTKQNKTKHSLLCRYGLTSAATLLLTFGGASAVKADEGADAKKRAQERGELLSALIDGTTRLKNKQFPHPGNTGIDNPYMNSLIEYLQEREQVEDSWRARLLKGIQDRVLDGQDGRNGEKGEQGLRGATGSAGPAGPRGPVGPQGPTGARGPAG
ncbi:TPA: collagen-like protein, partial [Streptococcus pyogenes]|nr:collagen-like protein [Streptococcus pyogenes]